MRKFKTKGAIENKCDFGNKKNGGRKFLLIKSNKINHRPASLRKRMKPKGQVRKALLASEQTSKIGLKNYPCLNLTGSDFRAFYAWGHC